MPTSKPNLVSKILLITASFVLIFSFLFFVLEKSQVINFYTKPKTDATATLTTRPVNDVDYTVEKSDPDPSINSEKQQSTEPTPSVGDIKVLITRANYNSVNKLINVGTLIEGTNTGNCKLELFANNEVKVTQNANIMQQGTYSTCQGFSVDASALASDKYTVKITVTNGTQSSNASQDVTL